MQPLWGLPSILSVWVTVKENKDDTVGQLKDKLRALQDEAFLSLAAPSQERAPRWHRHLKLEKMHTTVIASVAATIRPLKVRRKEDSHYNHKREDLS